MGLLPLGVFAQTNKPQSTVAPTALPGNVRMAPPQPTTVTEMPDKGKLSYSIGMFFAKNITNSIKRGDLSVNNEDIIAAISDVLNGKTPRLSEKEVTAVFDQLRKAMVSKKAEEETVNKAKGEAYLAQFAKTPGVTTLPGGLEYKVIKEGDGPRPTENDTVTVADRGTLIDGTEFDHTDSFTTPIKGGIISGWRSVLPLMKTGSKWQVVIPSSMGYGPRGRPPKIPANATLIFEMELKSVTPGAAPSHPPVSAAPPPPHRAGGERTNHQSSLGGRIEKGRQN